MSEPQKTNGLPPREHWGTKVGVILAVAGSAVGLGNFLRFPGIAVQNGGGAFMIPYFLAFLLLGIPICWAEWIMGRRAGRLSGLSSSPGLFSVLTKGSPVRFVGALGLFVPVIIYMYYVYVESWCLAYFYFSLSGALNLKDSGIQDAYTIFFNEYTGNTSNGSEHFFSSIALSYGFFLFTFFVNFYFIYRGLSRGIELFCRVAMPLLLFMAVIMVIRVITLGTPDPQQPEQSVINGLGFMWNPDWNQLGDPKVWLSACGQVFFSLSVGFGIIVTYASYLRKKDDVVLSGLTASATNEFCEVCVGGLMVIPAAMVFLGTSQMLMVAQESTFGIGFVVMPQIFDLMPAGQWFGTMFYFLLFLAGVTSSLSMLQPAIAFFEEGFGLNRRASVTILGLLTFLGVNGVIFAPGTTAQDTIDKYAAELGIPLLALFEVLVFIFILKIPNAIREAGHGADMRLPRIFGFAIKYITPLFLVIIIGWWFKGTFSAEENFVTQTKEAVVAALPEDYDVDLSSIEKRRDVIPFLQQELQQEMPQESKTQLQDLLNSLLIDKERQPYRQITIVCMVVFFGMLLILQGLAWPMMKRRYKAYQRAMAPEDLD